MVEVAFKLIEVFLTPSNANLTFICSIYISMLKLKTLAQIFLGEQMFSCDHNKVNLSPLYLHFSLPSICSPRLLSLVIFFSKVASTNVSKC